VRVSLFGWTDGGLLLLLLRGDDDLGRGSSAVSTGSSPHSAASSLIVSRVVSRIVSRVVPRVVARVVSEASSTSTLSTDKAVTTSTVPVPSNTDWLDVALGPADWRPVSLADTSLALALPVTDIVATASPWHRGVAVTTTAARLGARVPVARLRVVKHNVMWHIGSGNKATAGVEAGVAVAVVHAGVEARVPIGVVEHNTTRQARGRHVARVVSIVAVAIARIVARVIVSIARIVAIVAVAIARIVGRVIIAIARIVARVIIVHSRVVARVAIAIVKLNTARNIGRRYIAAGIVAVISIVHAWVVARRTSSSSPSSTHVHVVPRTAGTHPAEPTARTVPRVGRELHGRHRDCLDGREGGAAGTRKDLQVVGGLKRWLLDDRRRRSLLPGSVVLPGCTEAGHNMTHGTAPLPGLRSPGLVPGPGHSLISQPWSGVGIIPVIRDVRLVRLGVRGGTLKYGATTLHLLHLGLSSSSEDGEDEEEYCGEERAD